MNKDKEGRLKIVAVALSLTVIFTYLLMVMGTFVTSTGSGLACPDWPLCYGTVAPPLELSIWFEWSHRLLGGVTSVLMLVSTVLVWKNYKGAPRVLTLAVLFLLAFGVLLGGLTVIVEAPMLSEFSHVAIISSHLVIATLVLSCLVFTLAMVFKSRASSSKGYFKILFAVVYLQVLIGILTRYSGATLACANFPLCNGGLLPSTTDYLVLLHFSHRVVALFVILTTVAVLYKALRAGSETKGFLIVLGLVIAQATFGVLIVLTSMFLPVIILHAATGFLLLGFLAYKAMPYFFTRTVANSVFEGEGGGAI